MSRFKIMKIGFFDAEIDVEEVRIDEVDNLPVEQRSLFVDRAVKDTVDEVTDSATENHGERNAKCEFLVSCLVEVDQNADARNDREDGEE